MHGVNHNERIQTRNETKPEEEGKQQTNKSKGMQGRGWRGRFRLGVNRSEVNMMLQVFNKTATGRRGGELGEWQILEWIGWIMAAKTNKP